MKRLIITAHPSSNGFTHKLAKKYEEGSKESGHEVEILDLYRTELKQDFLYFEDARNIPADPTREKMRAKILWADQLVFIFPMWWTDAPAIMKNFIDQNFSAGFAFRHKSNGLPEGLLKGRTARVFMTCDGPALYYRLMLSPFRIIWGPMRLSFCGIKMLGYRLFDGMRKRSDGQKAKWLDEVYNLAKK